MSEERQDLPEIKPEALPERETETHVEPEMPVASAPDETPAAAEAPEPPPPVEPDLNAAVLAASRKHTRRSFAVAGLAAVAGYGLYKGVTGSGNEDMQSVPLRRAFEANAGLSRALFRDRALTPTYPLKRAETLRVNGVYGLKQALEPQSWRLQLVGARAAQQSRFFVPDVTAWEYRYSQPANGEDPGHDTKVRPQAADAKKPAPDNNGPFGRPERGGEEAGESESTLRAGTPGLLLPMSEITRLPRRELVTQFKCIEGWSQVVQWAGVRMADFLEQYPPAMVNGREPRYVYMETPDGDYYTGYDLDACRHPQTLLVTEMMGAPLTQFHGAPLRLHMPIKYGYKQIKRIGLIHYTDTKPDDYWTKLGYDWYAGL